MANHDGNINFAYVQILISILAILFHCDAAAVLSRMCAVPIDKYAEIAGKIRRNKTKGWE